MALTAEEKQLCAEWLTEPARKWQVLNRSQWKYQFREKTLVRFVEEATMDESIVPLLLEYLTSDDCKSTIQLYGQAVSSEWAPTRAWYEISNKAVGNVKAVRLYHALSIEPENGEDGPYLIEDGCAYRVSWTNYWKRSSVQQVPQSTSGVSYHIVNLQRDPDTGLFSYSIEKRERVQQDIEEYLTRSTAFEDVSEEVHMGVRGDPSLGGKQASVSNGKTVTRKVTKNADCTHDVHNTITQDKAAPGAVVTTEVGVRGTTVTTENRNMPAPASTEGLAPGESVRNQQTDSKLWNQTIRRLVRNVLVWLRGTCRKTIFDHSHSETTNVKDDPGFSHVEEAGNGVIHELTVQKTAEGYDVTESTTEEKSVPEASESIHVELDGTIRTVVNRNQQNKAPAPTEIGSSVTNERTHGGRWNQTIRSLVKNAFLKIGETCAKTFFVHRHSKTTVQSNDPGFSHAEDAGNGRVVSKSVTRTSTGAFRIEENETTEKPVQSAVVEIAKTLHGTRKTVTDKSQQNAVSETGLKVGERRSTRKTEGGLNDNTVSTLTGEPAGKIAKGESKTIFENVDTERENVAAGGVLPSRSADSAGDGKTHSVDVHLNEDGSADVIKRDKTEKAVGDAGEIINVSLEGKTKTVIKRNQSAKEPEPSDNEIGKSVENTKTEGGRWNTKVRTVVKGALLRLGEACRKTIFEHRHSKTTVQSNDPGFSHAEDAGNGRVVSKSVTRTSTGAFRIEENETTEKPVHDAVVTKRMTLNGLSVQKTHRNQSEPMPDPTKVGKSVSNRKTDGGRYDVTETDEGVEPAGKTGESCSHDAFTHRHSVTKNEKDPQEVETGFERGKIIHKTATLTGNGTANNSTDTITALPKVHRYTYTREDDAIVHVIKYRNQQEIPNYPDSAAGLNINDSINAFELHDGMISYLTNVPYKVTFGDLKFIKHGASQKFYEIAYSRRTRRFKHRVWTVQIHHIKGDAYTDYVSDWQRADIGRTTSGVMCTQLISRYKDKDGNDLAEWKWVELTEPPGNGAWVICTQSCKHQWKEFSQEDFRKAAKALLAGGGDASADDDKFHKDLIATLKEMPLATAAAMSGMTLDEKKAEIARLEAARKGAK